MSVLAIFTAKHISKKEYEALRREVGWETKNPAGGIAHVASFDTRGGLKVADVWESPQALETFINQRLAPAMQKLGIEPPSHELYQVYNLNVYKSAEPFVLS